MILLAALLLVPAELHLALDERYELPTLSNTQIHAQHPLIVERTGNQTSLYVTQTTQEVIDTYVYAAPATDKVIVAASAHPVRIHVQETSSQTTNPLAFLLAALGALVLCAAAWRVSARSAAG